MSKHIANKEQQQAFNNLVKAFEKCKNIGLIIYGKSDNIVAYTKEADNYVEKEHGIYKCLNAVYGQIPNLSASVLADSGADDYPSYITKKDRDNFNP